MKLITAHKVLIGASIALGGLFTVWACAMYFKNSSSTYAIAAAAALGATAALASYLKRFIEKNKQG